MSYTTSNTDRAKNIEWLAGQFPNYTVPDDGHVPDLMAVFEAFANFREVAARAGLTAEIEFQGGEFQPGMGLFELAYAVRLASDEHQQELREADRFARSVPFVLNPANTFVAPACTLADRLREVVQTPSDHGGGQ